MSVNIEVKDFHTFPYQSLPMVIAEFDAVIGPVTIRKMLIWFDNGQLNIKYPIVGDADIEREAFNRMSDIALVELSKRNWTPIYEEHIKAYRSNY